MKSEVLNVARASAHVAQRLPHLSRRAQEFVWRRFLITCNLNHFYSKLFCVCFRFTIQYVGETDTNWIKKLSDCAMCPFGRWHVAEIIFFLVQMNQRTRLQRQLSPATKLHAQVSRSLNTSACLLVISRNLFKYHMIACISLWESVFIFFSS